jgi:hypothetical protein
MTELFDTLESLEPINAVGSLVCRCGRRRRSDSTRRLEHVADAVFTGVYELLATRLPMDRADEVHRALVQRAADTMDYGLLTRYTQLLRTRTGF